MSKLKLNISTNLSFINKWLLKFSGYYSEGRFYLLNGDAPSETSNIAGNTTFKPFIMVLARKHYHELNRTYPIENIGEVKKLIKLEYEGQRVHFNVAKRENGKTQVNIWVIKQDVPYALVILPESFIYASFCPTETILQVDSNPVQFITMHNKVVYSQTANTLIDKADDFALSIGVPANAAIEDIGQDQKQTLILEKIRQNLLGLIKIFGRLPKVKLDKPFWAKAILPSIVVGLIYLSLSSAYVFAYKSYLQHQIEAQGLDVNSAMDVNELVGEKLNDYNALSAFLDSKPHSELVWFVLPDLVSGVDFRRFEFRQGRFIVVGHADRATTLLNVLNKNMYVRDAKFDTQTRRNRGRDIFTISFTVEAPSINQVAAQSHDK